jgi:hypothetical protein
MMTALTIAGGLCLLLCIGIRGRMIAEETERAEAAEGEAYLARLDRQIERNKLYGRVWHDETGLPAEGPVAEWPSRAILDEIGSFSAPLDPRTLDAMFTKLPPAAVIHGPVRRTEPRGVNLYPDEDLPSVARGAGILGPEDLR